MNYHRLHKDALIATAAIVLLTNLAPITPVDAAPARRIETPSLALPDRFPPQALPGKTGNSSYDETDGVHLEIEYPLQSPPDTALIYRFHLTNNNPDQTPAVLKLHFGNGVLPDRISWGSPSGCSCAGVTVEYDGIRTYLETVSIPGLCSGETLTLTQTAHSTISSGTAALVVESGGQTILLSTAINSSQPLKSRLFLPQITY